MEPKTIKVTIFQSIKEFGPHLSADGKTSSTIEAYMGDLHQFYKFMKEQYPSIVYIEDLRRNYIQMYLEYLQNEKCKTHVYTRATFERKCDSLMTFCNYLVDMEYKEVNIMNDKCKGLFRYLKSGCEKIYGNDFKPHILSPGQIDEILNFIEQSRSIRKTRDYAIIEMLHQLGIRISTLSVCNWSDIDFSKPCITLHHVKDKTVTTVPISNTLKKALLTYKYGCNGQKGRLFNLQPKSISEVVKKYMIKTGAYVSGQTSHRFRHTFIMDHLRRGVDVQKIIQYTGHRDVSSLKSYVNWLPKDLFEIVELYDSSSSESTESTHKGSPKPYGDLIEITEHYDSSFSESSKSTHRTSGIIIQMNDALVNRL